MAATEQWRAEEAIRDVRLNQEAIREMQERTKDLTDAEERHADELRGNAKRLAAEDLAVVKPMIESGQVPIPDALDPEQISKSVDDFVSAKTVGMGDVYSSAYSDGIRAGLSGAIAEKVASNLAINRDERLTDLVSEAVTLQTPDALKALVQRGASSHSMTEHALIRERFIPAAKELADRGDPAYESTFRPALASYGTYDATLKAFDAKYLAARDSIAIKTSQQRVDLETNRITDMLYLDGTDTETVRGYVESVRDVLPDAFKRTIANELESRDKTEAARLERQRNEEAFSAAKSNAVSAAAGLFKGGASWLLPDKSVIEIPGFKSETLTRDEIQSQAADVLFRQIEQDTSLAPVQKLLAQAQLAGNNSYSHAPWNTTLTQGFDAASVYTLSRDRAGGDLPPQTLAGLNIYRTVSAVDPRILRADQRVLDFYETASEFMRDPAIGNDPKRALSEALRVTQNPRTIGPMTQQAIASEAAGLLDRWGPFNDKGKTVAMLDVVDKAERYARMGFDPKEAVRRAGETLSRQRTSVNGYYVRLHQPVPTVYDVEFPEAAEQFIADVAGKVAAFNNDGERPLKVEDVRMEQDRASGLFLLIDNRTGFQLVAGPGMTVPTVSMSAIMQHGEAKRMKALRSENVANRVGTVLKPEMVNGINTKPPVSMDDLVDSGLRMIGAPSSFRERRRKKDIAALQRSRANNEQK